MTVKNGTPELEIEEMSTTSSLPAKPDELADIEPILAEVRNQQTGEFEKVMISPHDIRKYICPKATLQELYIFMSICRHQGIDPISEAYFVKFGDLPGFTVMKYTVYLKRALQSGVLKSIRHEFDDEDNPTKIMVYIQRNDMEGEWCWTTYRKSVEKRRKSDNKVTEIWDTQLHFMMCKCGYSQALRFFCADAVGALPPTQEEMPGIGALNMQSPLTGISTGILAEGTEVPGEVLEVESVEPLPEHQDMAPLRNTFHGMIKGMFKDADERHKWQEEKTGVASMKEWGPDEYAKAYKALSQEAGPPNGTQEHSQEDHDEWMKTQMEKAKDMGVPGKVIDIMEGKTEDVSEETPKTADATPAEEAVKDAVKDGQPKSEYLASVRRKYVAHVSGRFETPEHQAIWQQVNVGEGDIDKWFAPDFLKALVLLDQADLEIQKNTAAGIELRKEYVDLVAHVFDDIENQIRWQKDITGEASFANWDPDQFRTAITEMQDFKELDPIAKQFVNLRLLYEERVEGRFASGDEMFEWQARVSCKTGNRDDWGIVHYNLALNALKEMDAEGKPAEEVVLEEGMELELYVDDKETVVKAKVIDVIKQSIAGIDADQITIEYEKDSKTMKAAFDSVAVQRWLKEGKWKLIQVDASEKSTTLQDDTELKPGMKLAIYLELTAETPSMTGKISGINENTNELILVGKNGAAKFKLDEVRTWMKQGFWKVVSPDTESGMSDAEFKELKALVAQLPKYHNNLGSTQFRDRAQEITGRRPRGIRTYTSDEADKLIRKFTDEVADYEAAQIAAEIKGPEAFEFGK